MYFYGFCIFLLFPTLLGNYYFLYKRQGTSLGEKFLLLIFFYLALFSVGGLFLFFATEDVDIFPGSLGLTRSESLSSFFFLMSITLVALFFSIVHRQRKELFFLEKVRFDRISFATALLTFIFCLAYLILPYFDIFIAKRDLLIISLLYVGYVVYILRKVYFRSLWANIARLSIHICGLSIAGFIYFIWEEYFSTILPILSMLGIAESSSEYLLAIVILFSYELSLSIMRKFFFGYNKESLKEEVILLEKAISIYPTLEATEKKVIYGMKKIFRVEKVALFLWEEPPLSYKHLYTYYKKDGNKGLYMKDIVYYKKKSHLYDLSLIEKELPDWVALALPIYSGNGLVGTIFLSQKKFSHPFDENELKAIRNLTSFIGFHVRYIETYRTLEDVIGHLDEKVVEKTLEYNDLINRQKEFIATLSHEVKGPITTAIFQGDGIMEDLSSGSLEKEDTIREIKELNKGLINIGSLLSRIFSVHYYDAHAVTLFPEKIDFAEFLEDEVSRFRATHIDIEIISSIETSIGKVDLDVVQFKQVLQNLMDNGIKFTKKSSQPTLLIRAMRYKETLILGVEDNGVGLGDVDREKIFDKYTVGKVSGAGIGMGLYLSKKIIEMHRGSIEAEESTTLGGAKFTIILPLSQSIKARAPI